MTLGLLLACSSTAATDSVLKIRTPDGIVGFRYNPDVISREDLRRYVKFADNVAAYNFYLAPEHLELCLSAAPQYAPCGSRDLSDRNFFKNAEVNIGRVRDRITELSRTAYPAELRPLVIYIKRIQEAQLEILTRELQYLSNGDAKVLAARVAGVDPGGACGDVLDNINSAKDKTDAYRIVSSDWVTCINHGFRSQLGPYPETEWKTFLLRYAIEESLMEKSVN
jgi:hypothetical protein